MKKRRHHYVWQHYLDAWTSDNSLWCQHEDRCFPTGTNNAAVRTDFYRLEEISDRELEFLEKVILEDTNDEIEGLARGWVEPFTRAHAAKQRKGAAGIDDEKFDELIDEAISNFEENLHARVEDNAIPFLDDLRDETATVLHDSERYPDFVFYLTMQYFRTPSIQQRVVSTISDFSVEVDIRALWPLARTIFATNVGFVLNSLRTRTQISFLETEGPENFITADQPIVNLKATETAEGEPPKELQLYYPLSPSLAMRLEIGEEMNLEKRTANSGEVTTLNDVMASKALEQLYAACEQDLRRYEDVTAWG